MSVESELRKMLENNGFEPKATKKGSIWTYYHPKYMVVNYHINGHIYFNYLGKYMRDEVKKTHGTIIGLSSGEKEHLYTKALSKLDFYENIKNDIKFSLREKGGDYVCVTENVGIKTLGSMLQFIIEDAGHIYAG